MPGHDDNATDAQERVLAAAHAAASWARARRATWTSAPLGLEPSRAAFIAPEPSAPPEIFEPEVATETIPTPELAAVATDAPPRRRSLPAPLVTWLVRAAVAAAIVAAAVAGGRGLWSVLPERSTPAQAPTAGARPAAATGSLHVRSTPPGARVLIDGTARGVTPLDLANLKPGRHEVELQGTEGSVTRTVTVTANATATLDEAIFSGFVTVYAPFEVTVSEGGRALKADDRQQIMLPPGAHDLRIANRALAYEVVRRVQITPGAATPLRVTPEPSPLTVTAAEPAEVWLDGARLGDTPLNAAPVALGVHEIVVKRAAGGERRFSVTVGAKPYTLAVDFTGR